jgi:predicted esterase
MPDPASLKDRRFFIYHSPQDFIKIQQAKDAVEYLTAHGSHVKMLEYQGGHGWAADDVYGDIQKGVAWLFTEK